MALSSIVVTGNNPRRALVIEELVQSIAAHGLLQPIVVRRRRGARYELIAGHRRFAAVTELGWTTVPAVIRSDAQLEAPVLGLVENLQRRDLHPTEEAAALEALVRVRGWTTRQVACAVKRSQAYVSKRLRVFDDPLLAPAVLSDQLSISAAEELLGLDERTRNKLLSLAIEEQWDRQQVRAAARGKGRFAANHPEREPGLTGRLRKVRLELRALRADQLTESDRRELRILFQDLAIMGRAPTEVRAPIFPPLEQSSVGSRRQRSK
ncbi:MAG: ParB/RepB/Spo0J family partition protein [Chloroflexi bacterium]|nr:ParB/RepB/Spo0J family partition protein [Chloroflexota bacterium]